MAVTERPQPKIMADFVFGPIEADDGHLLASERQRWQGLRHGHDLQPLVPAPGQPVQIRVTVGPETQIDRLCVYLTSDGSPPTGSRGRAQNGQALFGRRQQVTWQPLLWGFVESWQAELPPQPAGTLVSYRIEGWQSQDDRPSHWSQEPNLEGAPTEPTLYGYHVDEWTTPAWAQQAVVYQIFVDRFARGPAGEAPHLGWLEPSQLTSFAGGDLAGVRARLDHIADLGASAIWLSPIFVAASYHGYDTIDYRCIDPRFGTLADLQALVAAAHRRGLRVILDFVANHCGREFPPFQAAIAALDSPYRGWFRFGADYTHGYRCFFDDASMPQLNLDHPQARAYMLDAARYWLTAAGIDGYRLDYAAGPSHQFWSAFRAACKEVNPDCWLFGEVTQAGGPLRTYAGRLDGCLDFAFVRNLRRLCLPGPGGPPLPISHFAAFLERQQAFFPAGFTLPAFIDNHDMNRFLWLAQGDRQRLLLAIGLLYTCGGPPILYYGTEVGLSQPRARGPWREESRHPMPWQQLPDPGLMQTVRHWIAARRAHPALTLGTLQTLYVDDSRGLWLARRHHQAGSICVAVNSSPSDWVLPLPPGTFTHLNGQPVVGALQLARCSVTLLPMAAGPVQDWSPRT